MKICYDPEKSFLPKSLRIIEQANAIITDYQAQGYTLTLRQLYYRFVAAGNGFENSEKSYDNLGKLISNARLAGRIDWDAIEDRTRNLQGLSHWNNPDSIISSAAHSFRVDKWKNQETVPEIWVEKEALAAIVQRVAKRNDVNFLSCRGYMSQSEMHEAGLRFVRYLRNKQTPIIIHLGDLDPSGVDMTRDITDRIENFVGYHLGQEVEVKRIALSMAQVEQYEPPPNPARVSDARYSSFLAKYGESSWELDALEPTVLDALMQSAVDSVKDPDEWELSVNEENHHRQMLSKASANWAKIEKIIASGKLEPKPRKKGKQ